VLVALLQKYIVEGLSAGAVKGWSRPLRDTSPWPPGGLPDYDPPLSEQDW